MLLLVEIGVLLLFAPELINAGVVNAGCFHLGGLFRLLEKCFKVNVGIAERAFQRITINLIMIREDDYSSIGVLHLYVAAFSVNLDKPQPRESRDDLLS